VKGTSVIVNKTGLLVTLSSKVIAWSMLLPGLLLSPQLALAQNAPCTNAISVQGTVIDPTSAVIAGAEVSAFGGMHTMTDAAGHYALRCVQQTSEGIRVQANGFASAQVPIPQPSNGIAHVDIQLQLAHVETNVEVHDDPTSTDADHGVGTRTLTTTYIQQLADDPDDLLRELEALAAGGGGMPGSALVTVDGFQNASAIPPKSSIASVRINPDMFSEEFEAAPYLGGRIEIITKPGADPFHGALFFTDSDGSFNATDPLSVTATSAGKRRYGFELSGPVLPRKIDFALGLEKRDIDEFNVVRAVMLDANGNPSPFQQTVDAPQRLWIASGRQDWQASTRDTATLSFSANVNSLGNQGIGGLTLPEAGYGSQVREYDLRLNNTLTLSPNMLHETRVGFTWKRTQQTPLSTTPSLQVSGYFIGGGAISQDPNDRERDLEVDDDLMATQGKHTWKVGAQSLGIFIHNYDPNTFNGAYLFGGGSAPALDSNNQPTGETMTITGIEQYRRALFQLPGGSPTTYQITNGNPLVPLAQWRLALYAQDQVKLAPQFTALATLRYQIQTTPDSFTNFSPRTGFAWSPDKKSTWVIHARAGIFRDPQPPNYETEAYRLNGIRQLQTTVYSPTYNSPLESTPGSIQVGTINQLSPHFDQLPSLQTHLSIEHTLHNQLHFASTLYWFSVWKGVQIRNVNAPMVASSVGVPVNPTQALLAPRPFAPNENIFEYQRTGHLSGNTFVFGISRNAGNHGTFNVDFVHVNGRTDATNTAGSPQSSYTKKGETSRPDWDDENAIWASGMVHLPWKLDLSANFDARSGQPYNITTGTDANGDGVFNDRPSYASAPGNGVYQTPFGLLTTNTVNGTIPRNLGTMPSLVHLDTNLSRTFTLNPKDKDHARTLSLNARSANLLNHTNVTGLNTVLSSSSIGVPTTAETARRVEVGARFSF
jgi:hypothetical protein